MKVGHVYVSRINSPTTSIWLLQASPRKSYVAMQAYPHFLIWPCWRTLKHDVAMQAYPKIYAATCKGRAVLQRMSQTGLVDMSNLSARITAGNRSPQTLNLITADNCTSQTLNLSARITAGNHTLQTLNLSARITADNCTPQTLNLSARITAIVHLKP